jgi:hypothetical protein
MVYFLAVHTTAGVRRRPGGALVALSMLVGLLASLIASAPVAAQTEGTSQLTITVDLKGEFVEVVEEIQVADTESDVIIRIPANASDVDVNGRIVDQSIDDRVQEYVLAVGSGGATIGYRLPGGVGAVDDTRVASDSVAFNLWPNMATVTVGITLPEGFRANVGEDFAEDEIATDTYRYTLDSVDFDRVQGLRFVALREEGLNRRLVEVGAGATIEVAGWLDDPEWLEYAVGYVESGIPALEGLVGQPWPASELELIQSTAPGEQGYGGWYDLRKAQIEVSEERDPELLLHELSHAWFNDTLFQQRWMVEGFAEAYAQAAVELLGDDVIGITAPGAPPDRFEGLNRWRRRFFFEDNFDEEVYGYRASSYVVAELLDEIGPDVMADVIDRMVDDVHPYAIDGDTRATGLNDWRRLLDLVELRGGSTDANGLFRRYIVTEGQEALLDERRTALEAFVTFEDEVAGGDRARVPEGVRYAMSAWEFDDATRGMERAREAQGRVEGLAARADALGLTLPEFLDDVYLASDTGFVRLNAILDDTDAALAGLEANDPFTEDEGRNFQLGRFDRMDLSAGQATGPVLNQDGEAGSSPLRVYGLVAAVAVLLLLVLAVVAARMPPPRPKEAGPVGGDGGPTPPPGQEQIPIYRPQLQAPAPVPHSDQAALPTRPGTEGQQAGLPPPPPGIPVTSYPPPAPGSAVQPPQLEHPGPPVDLESLPPPPER